MSKFEFIIYGSDTKPTVEAIPGFPLKSALDAKVTALDAEAMTFRSLGLYPEPTIESDKSEYLGGYKTVTKDLTLKFNLKGLPVDFPGTDTSMDDFLYLPIFKYDYTWVYIPSDYHLIPELIKATPQNYVMEVIIMGLGVESSGGTKTINIELERAYKE